MAKRKNRQKGDVNLFLGEDCVLVGELTFAGEARVYGKFKGEIKGEGHLLVGPTAHVAADIQATAVEISGNVAGDVNAFDRIEMRRPGRLVGNINAPLVIMDEGVHFDGKCTMNSQKARDNAPQIALLASSGE